MEEIRSVCEERLKSALQTTDKPALAINVSLMDVFSLRGVSTPRPPGDESQYGLDKRKGMTKSATYGILVR
jgi:hypothetical protein